jgi:NAD(P)-dependent dehydrogenase (short-subunit alcohol dehydrogenase family)
MNELRGRSALVTGAGRGFGRAIALAFAQAGAGLTLTSRSEEELGRVAREIQHSGGAAIAMSGDAREAKTVEQVCARHRDAYGAADILVNCAGSSEPYGPVGQVDVTRWWRSMELHLLAPLAFMTYCIPEMQRRGRGCIINVASLAAGMTNAHQSAYCVGKSALVRLSEHVAAENRNTGVAVFPIHPGFTITELAKREGLGSAEARRWVPDFVALLETLQASGGGEDCLTRCGASCVALASGRYNRFSGQFLNLANELPALDATGLAS